MNPKPILITKELDKQGPLPIQLPQNPKKVVLNSRQDYIDSLRNGKKCFKICLKPVNQDLEKFENCLLSCVSKSIKVNDYLRTTEFIEAVVPVEKKRKRSIQ